MGFAAFGEYSTDIENWLIENVFFQNIWGKKMFFLRKQKGIGILNLSSVYQHNLFLQIFVATF